MIFGQRLPSTLSAKDYRQILTLIFILVLGTVVSTSERGGLINLATAAEPNQGVIQKEGQITLNFTDADIRQIIDAVSKVTGQNFIVDPRVKGKVTIISQRPMDAKEVYQVFLSILKVHGFAAVPGKNVVKIVPDVNAKQEAIDTVTAYTPSSSDELVTQVIEVRHVDAAQLVPILRPLVPQKGHLAAVPSSNVIIISDSAANIARLVTIIERIDQATGDEVELISLNHASASEVVRILTQLQTKDPKAAKADLQLVADDRTNSILIGGDKTSRLRVRTLIAHLDTPLQIGGNTHVVYLRNAVAKDLVPVLTGVSQNVAKAKAKGGAQVATSDIVIQADENTNALVITAPPDIFRSLKTVIQKLDVRRAQVMVESVIAEVSQNFARELGVQWVVDGSDNGNVVGLINFNVGTPITAFLDLDNPPLPVGATIGAGKFDEGSTRYAAILRALAADGYTNILATPNLVTLDNEEAEIVVGQNVPFVTGSFTTPVSNTPQNPFQTIERQDVGLTLKIKPQINEGDSIKMDVTQEVSSIAAASLAASDLITNKRSIKTSVMVDDGQMLVLGGLIQDDFIEQQQKVPGLGDIPVLGWLFRYNKTTKVKTNLMVFLHPTILKDERLTLSMTNDKYTYIREEQLKERERSFKLYSEEESPVLPEMQQMLELPPPYEESAQRLELSAPPTTLSPAVDDNGTPGAPPQ